MRVLCVIVKWVFIGKEKQGKNPLKNCTVFGKLLCQMLFLQSIFLQSSRLDDGVGNCRKAWDNPSLCPNPLFTLQLVFWGVLE